MLRFKDYLKEGGNVVIGDVSAERIDLSKHDRDKISNKLLKAINVINAAYIRKHGTPLWSKHLIKTRKFLSGSSFHFFNKSIPTKDFVGVKTHLGDIDTQVDQSQEKNIEEFLNSIIGKTFGYITFIGFKKSAGQFITLWNIKGPDLNVQIDLELVEFENQEPTEWSQFSHSSSWEDLKEGIKGVAHKYILRAITAKAIREIILLKGKRQTPHKILSYDLAFSVQRGLRQKIEPVLDENGEQVQQDGILVYKEIPTSESNYIKDVSMMFKILFDREPKGNDIRDFGSFVGILKLVYNYLSVQEPTKFIEGFAYSLWGKGATGMYRGNPTSDNEEKTVMFNKMISILHAPYDKMEIQKNKEEYYTSYK